MKTAVAGLPAALLIVLALGTVPAAAGPRPSPAAQACAAGLAALNAGSLGPAMKTYNSVVPAGAACAKAGRTAAGDLLTAQALIRAGYAGDALTYVEKALDAEPTLVIPRDVLPPTVGPQGRALAESLEENGFPVQARQVLHQVIQNDAGIPLDPYDRAILGETSPPWYSRALHFMFNPLVPAVLITVLILLLLVGGVLARLRRRLHFQPFTVGDGAAAGPETAGTLRTLIRRELHRLADEDTRLGDGRRLRLDQAGPYEDHFDLGPVLDGLSPAWKPAAAASGVLVKALPAKARLVSGTVLPGDAVILEISTVHGVAKRMCEIIHSEFDFPPSRQDVLHQLALPSAAWIALAHFPEARLGGTRDWRSYVAFAAGCAWQAQGNLGRARACYIRACDNPDNLAARINLAALDQNADYAAAPADPTILMSYQRLSELVQDTAHMTGDLQWYRTRYLMSAGLRDILDLAPDSAGRVTPVPSANGHHRRPAVPDRRDPDGPKPGETLIQLALRLAVQLALQLEREIAEPDSLPETFVAYGRAAALTLVASQVRRKTDDLAKVLIEPGDRLDYTSGGAVRKALASVLHDVPEDGIAERLVDFARVYCPLDDQAHYNLYRYHRTRAKILETAIDSWYRERPPTSIGQWSAWKSDIGDLKNRFEAELAQMKVAAQQVTQAGDSALIARVRAVSALDPQPGNGRWRAAEESLQWERTRIEEAVPPLAWDYDEPVRSEESSGPYEPRHGQAAPDPDPDPGPTANGRLELPGEADEDQDP
jgi:hypothetical protein